jgi:RNA polymerase sigma-70 factor (family 1)
MNEDLLQTLKEQIAAGDQLAFRKLFDHYAKKLTLFSASIIRSADEAREVVDEVFVKIWRKRAELPSVQNLRVYLYTATKNTSLNYLSAKARESATEPFDFFDIQLTDGDSPEKKMITSELSRKIAAAIDALPPRCKMVFKLVREDGLSYKEVARILNISPKTVDAQMVIAVKQISEKLRLSFDFFPTRVSRKN